MRLSNIALAVSAQYGGLFKPSSLFTTGVNGAWYDPSDFSTMFQDASGTTPVTAVGQPVGLMLDKSKGLVLGAEQIPNYDFTNWNTAGGLSSRTATSFTTTSGGGVTKAIPSGYGKTYQIRIAGTTSVTLTVRNSGTLDGSTAINAGTFDVTITSPACFAAAITLYLALTGAGTATISTLSVRELPGNHAFNPSGNSANFPVLSARYNLLTKTEDFSDAVWNKTAGVTIDSTKYQAPDDTLTATRITFASASLLCSQSVSAVVTGRQYTSRVWIKGTAGQTIDISTAGTDEVVTLTGGWQFYTGTKNFTTTGAIIISTYGGATAREVLVWHPDVRAANDALNQPDYQRVNTATDYDTVGFKPYLSFNGVNQWLQTNSIDLTYGDKMFVSAGVRKLSDAAGGIVFETSNIYTNAGAFGVFAPAASAAPTYTFASTGNIAVATTASGYSAPITNVLSGIGNISGDQAILRVNGAQAAINTGDQGTGNYGNYPLYIGARAGSSLWFNGRLYGLVVAGKQASASEIASTEAWLNQKTGAY